MSAESRWLHLLDHTDDPTELELHLFEAEADRLRNDDGDAWRKGEL